MLMTLATAACWVSLLAPALAEERTMEADRQAIEAAVMDYFEGQGERSAERLNRAFHAETAQMVGVLSAEDGGTEIRSWAMRETIPRWSEGEPSTAERKGEILSMNIADGRLATVMFDSDGRFFDALTLAKIDGEWKIVQKVFIRQDQ
ncbi:nuclear transport factor 2 family protein [Parvularcula lutaonensis]|uniref:Nuclear transport factor 2 family protein n=1 Tax=Parvularcula lutaonensis TaxID=491923 RepID=A0ABV7MBW4_9PROT|nr:nuclear transport factor 2 family protein [Parvularcula lutaonensis]GGY36613.1 hypothetical protein GCM10007148_00990 [Parvularcula lutaonensis]